MYLEILFVLIVTFCAYQLLIRYAKNLNLVDIPNIRSSHTVPTIRGFGLVIFSSVCVTLLIFNLSFFIENIYLLSAVFLIVLLGLVDDIKETLPMIKIGTVIVVYLLLYIDGFLITNLGIFIGVSIELYFFVSILFTLFALVAFTNAFNLIDGLDGLSGLISMIILFSFLFIGYENNDQLLIIIPILFIAYGAKSITNKVKSKALEKGIVIKKVLGVLCAIMAISIITGFDKRIEAFLLKLTPEFITNISLTI